ncbi:helix-turn-helix transcriptional regulator [Rhodopirellula sp. P2]|uniref:helix-turn-helix transcriptional regulator n=1 Tax=Rhodopirellula sp. P2 TaxID=2127060 RepID=UPI0023681625|nr:MarR family transcriptional regulator [Rhodopirellula sp. P2]WDQ16090.1 winged helix-turn-helix transcriptional regulator [Rhodopirellula sp. P2]
MAAKKVTRGTRATRSPEPDAKPKVPKTATSPEPKAAETRPTARWTFLTNHAHVLIVLHAQPDLVLREVAVQVGITERAVQRIVQDLEDEGFIRREKVGRKNHYEVLTDQALRHPIEAHRHIGDLLKLITG